MSVFQTAVQAARQRAAQRHTPHDDDLEEGFPTRLLESAGLTTRVYPLSHPVALMPDLWVLEVGIDGHAWSILPDDDAECAAVYATSPLLQFPSAAKSDESIATIYGLAWLCPDGWADQVIIIIGDALEAHNA